MQIAWGNKLKTTILYTKKKLYSTLTSSVCLSCLNPTFSGDGAQQQLNQEDIHSSILTLSRNVCLLSIHVLSCFHLLCYQLEI